MATKKQRKKKRRTLEEEIKDTENKDQHESVSLSISTTRGLYLHSLKAMCDGDYASLSAYVSDLIRRDKHIKNAKPPSLEEPSHPIGHHEVPPGPRAKLGFEKRREVMF